MPQCAGLFQKAMHIAAKHGESQHQTKMEMTKKTIEYTCDGVRIGLREAPISDSNLPKSGHTFAILREVGGVTLSKIYGIERVSVSENGRQVQCECTCLKDADF